jgi:hypothetical protein
MTAFRPHEQVRTPDGIGCIIHILPDGSYRVMMNNYPKGRDTYSGTYDHPFTEKSVTVSKTYQEEEIEHL